MSMVITVARRAAVAAVGIGIVSAGLAGWAHADEAPAPAVPAPTLSRLPVPVLFQPVDASDGLFGIPRGSLPGIGLPGMAVVPLPEKDTEPATPGS
jgi:hypothetical protein